MERASKWRERPCADNVFSKRLWRSLEHDHVCLHDHKILALTLNGRPDVAESDSKPTEPAGK
jgi:hypothetical protein